VGGDVTQVGSALSPVKGKFHGVPIYDLLGGPARDAVRVYTWIGGNELDSVAEQAAVRREQGFTAVNMNASGRLGPLATIRELDAAIERVAAVRDIMVPTAEWR
jgi:galactonate dehydratase